MTEYPFIIKPLSEEDDGGYLIEYPDLPGCMSDGQTIEEAITHGADALGAWIDTAKSLGRAVPKPSSTAVNAEFSGKFVQRLPKSLHAELSRQAKLQGVSINALTLSFIARGVGFVDTQTKHPS